MARYASQTTVSVAKTKADIEGLLTAHGCDQVATASGRAEAMIAFVIPRESGTSLGVRIRLPLPNPNLDEFRLTPASGKERSPEVARRLWEQACRAHWRALLLVLKAKLEAIAVGISTLEREFLPDVMMPSGMTVEQTFGEELGRALEAGNGPNLLPSGGER